MNIVIKNKKENKALKRIEIEASVSFNKATPSRKEIQKAIAKEVKGNEKLTVIKNIYTKFGVSEATISAFIYEKEDVMNSLERKNLLEKHIKVEEKKEEVKEETKEEEKSEKKAEEKEEETKTEEVKVETKEEPKAEAENLEAN